MSGQRWGAFPGEPGPACAAKRIGITEFGQILQARPVRRPALGALARVVQLTCVRRAGSLLSSRYALAFWNMARRGERWPDDAAAH